MSLLALFTIISAAHAQSKVIWEIGTADNQSTGMALAPSGYKRFLEHDFGWEDRYFIIGHSKAAVDFPYVLPGPKDKWGGTAPTSGIRSHLLNILFDIDNVSSNTSQSDSRLIIDLLGYNSATPPKDAPTKVEYNTNDINWPTDISPLILKVTPYQTTATMDPNKQNIINDAK